MKHRVYAAILCAIFGSCASLSAGTISADGKVQDFREIIQTAKKKVFPAVVFITSISERYEGGKKEKSMSAGSGVIISETGEAVTNWHVVDKTVALRILLLDGEVGEAEVIGSDKDTDLALIKIKVEGREKFPFAELGDSSKLTEGQFVMAMGAPWGLSRSVSLGILSCTTRFLPNGQYNLWLQTDASINPGNSGGPLINTSGDVIGINTLGTFYGGDMAFSIPSNVVKRTVSALRKDGKVERAWTGIRVQPLKDFERNTFYKADTGVLVASVDNGSPAEMAGVKVRDLILTVNGAEIKGVNREDLPEINQFLAELAVEKPVEMKVKRGEEQLTLTMTPRKKGKVEGDDFDCRDWNVTVKAINEFHNPTLFFYRKKGVFVQGVKYPGNATNSGIRRGDIILSVDGKDVDNLDELEKIYTEMVKDENRDKKTTMVLLRNGLKHYLVLDYATKFEQD
ncbi:MAG: trypsin-like peptidase domain-containing protein [Planctomycetes bacterium]|nr:trypsin-like peptidase domain-containing protein [Planctomycetota bacterium]